MRHRVAHRKLGRVTEHRIALLRNQASALLRSERIRTTVPRAKELRPFVERIISIAKRSLATPDDAARGVTARRLVARDIADRKVVKKLFDTIAPRYTERNGGYTRLLRVGYRRGDSAEVAEVELLGSEYDPNKEAGKGGKEAKAGKPEKSSGMGRFRQAIRGGGRPSDEGASRADKQAKGARKVTTPRKAGGS